MVSCETGRCSTQLEAEWVSSGELVYSLSRDCATQKAPLEGCIERGDSNSIRHSKGLPRVFTCYNTPFQSVEKHVLVINAMLLLGMILANYCHQTRQSIRVLTVSILKEELMEVLDRKHASQPVSNLV